MEDIKVGEFIRLKNGIIDKVEEIKGEDTYTLVFTKKNVYVLEWLLNNIEKHSTNILDLIKLKDVLKLKDEYNNIFYVGIEADVKFFNECIESIKNKEVQLLKILTYEQFENASYEVIKNAYKSVV